VAIIPLIPGAIIKHLERQGKSDSIMKGHASDDHRGIAECACAYEL